MIKKTVTYTDFNGVERTEDFYFNLTEAEISEMELSKNGGYSAMIEKVTKANDQAAIINVFKEFVMKAYGEKSEDGRRFMKSPEIRAAFAETNAYSDIFMELATDAKAAIDFITRLIPQNLKKRLDESGALSSVVQKSEPPKIGMSE